MKQLNKLVLKIVNRLLDLKFIEKKDEDIYSYQVEMLLLKITGILLIAVIGVLTKKYVETANFYITFSRLRIYTNGYHSEKCQICLLQSAIVYTLMCKVLYIVFMKNMIDFHFITLISIIIIYIFSPVNYDVIRLNKKEIKRHKKVIKNILSIYLIILAMVSNFVVWWRTIIGDGRGHDACRPLIGGAGTFNKVYDNIISLLDKHINVTLSINISQRNWNYIIPLFERIPFKYRESINLSIRNLFQDKENQSLYDIHRATIDCGYIFSEANKKLIPCEAAINSSLLINPDLRVAPCSVVSEKGVYFGRISKDGDLLIKQNSIYYTFKNTTHENNHKCKKCANLPICLGGCISKQCIEENFCVGNKIHGINFNDFGKLKYLSDKERGYA